MIKSQCYQQLHYEERIAIASFQAQGLSIRVTARILNRAASTIGRAILRNAPSGQYSCMFAQKRRNRRRVFCRAAPKLGLVYKRGSCGRRRYCTRSALATCAWANPRPNLQAAKHSASSSRQSCNANNWAIHCVCWTSQRPACIRLTWTSCWCNWTAKWRPATQ